MVIIMATAIFSGIVSADPLSVLLCGDGFRKIVSKAESTEVKSQNSVFRTAGRGVFHLAKAGFYPFFGPNTYFKHHLFAPTDDVPSVATVKQDWKHMLGYLGIKALADLTSNDIEISDYKGETSDFIEEGNEGTEGENNQVIVVVNAFEPGHDIEKWPYQHYLDEYQEHPKKKFKQAHYIRARDLEELLVKLHRLVNSLGRKIDRVDYYSEGTAGFFWVGNDALDPGLLKSIANHGWGTEREQATKTFLNFEGLMAKNAKWRLNSCNTGQGDPGEELLKTLGETVFPRYGGTIYGSRLKVAWHLQRPDYPRLKRY